MAKTNEIKFNILDFFHSFFLFRFIYLNNTNTHTCKSLWGNSWYASHFNHWIFFPFFPVLFLFSIILYHFIKHFQMMMKMKFIKLCLVCVCVCSCLCVQTRKLWNQIFKMLIKRTETTIFSNNEKERERKKKINIIDWHFSVWSVIVILTLKIL